jgi:hypothetical protein
MVHLGEPRTWAFQYTARGTASRVVSTGFTGGAWTQARRHLRAAAAGARPAADCSSAAASFAPPTRSLAPSHGSAGTPEGRTAGSS